MTKQEFVSICLKLLGVFAIIESLPLLQHLTMIISMLGDDAPKRIWMFIGLMVPFLLVFTAGVFLLRSSEKLGAALVREDDTLGTGSSLHSKDIQAVAFSVVAVLVFLLAVPRLIHVISNIWILLSMEPPSHMRNSLVVNTWQMAITAAVQMGLATFLFFRSQGLVNFWRRIQTSRYVKAGDAEPNAAADADKLPR